MAFDRQAALQAGYTEEEIDSYLQNQAGSPPPPPPTEMSATGEPPAPTTTVTPAGEGSYAPTLATAGLAAAGAAVPAAVGYGVAKYGSNILDMAKNLMGGAGSVPVQPVTPAPNPTAIGLPQAAPAPTPAAAPRTMPSGRPYSAAGQQFLQQQAAQEAQQIQKANQIVRQLALDKLLKGGIGAGAALYSPGLNTNEQQELARRRMMPPTITGQ